MVDRVNALGSGGSGAAAEPTLLAELELSERLIVWAFRCWIAPVSLEGYILREFARRFGAREAEPALAEFARFVEALHAGARRVLYFHQPSCPCVGRDELGILGLLAAAQAADAQAAHAAAMALTRPSGTGALLSRARRLAGRLADNDLLLPARAASISAVGAAANDDGPRSWLQ
ncbi:MAG: hypothetical protein ACOY3L_16840 [Pseudomonadota bacterium]